MTSSTPFIVAFTLAAAGAVSACQPTEPVVEPTTAAGSAAEAEPAEPATMEHAAHNESGHPTGAAATPSEAIAADEEASGVATHMDHGGMNMPELGEYDPADWSNQPGAAEGDVTRCPVSGEEFRVTEDSTFFEHNGEKVYFCCPGCIRQFQRNPDALLAAAFPSEGSAE